MTLAPREREGQEKPTLSQGGNTPWVVPHVVPLVVLPVTLWLSRGCPVYLLGSIRAPSPGRNTKIHHPHNQQEPGEVMRRGAEHERERKRCGEEPNMRERERARESASSAERGAEHEESAKSEERSRK